MSDKQAYEIKQISLSFHTINCLLLPQAYSPVRDAKLYKEQDKVCQPVFKKVINYLSDHGISGVTEAMLLNDNVMETLNKKSSRYDLKLALQ